MKHLKLVTEINDLESKAINQLQYEIIKSLSDKNEELKSKIVHLESLLKSIEHLHINK